MIPSAELNAVLPGDRDGHVLAFGIEESLAELEGERRDLAATAAWITAQGGVAYLAHPYWTGARPGTLELPDTVSGIEVFNAGCELELGRGLSTVHWDELLEAGRSCSAIATDDSHHPGFDSDLAWTWVRAEPTAEACSTRCAPGASTSTGAAHPRRRRGWRRGRGPVHSVRGRSRSSSGSRVGQPSTQAGSDTATAARSSRPTRTGSSRPRGSTCPRRAPYARVEVADARGGRAWTNPL